MSNILLITYGFPPDVGGAELVAYDYATNLAKLGHNISVVCRQHKSKSVQFNNFKVMEIPNLFGEKLWMLNLYIFFLKNRRICNYLVIRRLFGMLENWVTR